MGDPGVVVVVVVVVGDCRGSLEDLGEPSTVTTTTAITTIIAPHHRHQAIAFGPASRKCPASPCTSIADWRALAMMIANDHRP